MVDPSECILRYIYVHLRWKHCECRSAKHFYGNEYLITSSAVGVNGLYCLRLCRITAIIGNLSDRWGRSRVYNYGFLVFVLGSVGCGLSNSLTMLILSRIFQAAILVSYLMSNSQAIVAEIFTNQRGKALGMVGTVVSLGSLTGPGVGGVLVQHFGWGSIFWINVPIGLIAFTAGLFILPKDRIKKKKQAFDYLGSFLFALGMVGFIFIPSPMLKIGVGTLHGSMFFFLFP